MYFYKLNNEYAISKFDVEAIKALASGKLTLESTTEDELKKWSGTIFVLTACTVGESRRSFVINDASQLFISHEDISVLQKRHNPEKEYAPWLMKAIEENRAVSLNTSYGDWYKILEGYSSKGTVSSTNNKWKVHVVGLGDVGGILCSGLRLLGGDCIESIGIFDKDVKKIERWYYECGQILSADNAEAYPKIIKLEEKDLFQCDMFVFCVSVGVPEIGNEKQDVRLVQFNGNSKIVSYYAKLARANNFKGIFAVVSDPVDLLCRAAYDASNKSENGDFDYQGLTPEQIRGYGLGVMNARAAFFASQSEIEEARRYTEEGRAFGPHGEGLIIANSIENFDLLVSMELTKLTREANLKVREAGFKPYIAPALSSGALSLIATIKGQWNYSATMLGSVFFGSRNRISSKGVEVESYNIPQILLQKLNETYEMLHRIYEERSNNIS